MYGPDAALWPKGNNNHVRLYVAFKTGALPDFTSKKRARGNEEEVNEEVEEEAIVDNEA